MGNSGRFVHKGPGDGHGDWASGGLPADDAARRARFEDLYRRHSGEIVAYVARRLGPHAAADVAADVFLVAWRRLDEVDPREPRAWLYGIARRLVANHGRRAGRDVRLVSKMRVLPDPVVDDAPEDAVVGAEENATVLRALERLRPGDREILVAVAWDEMTVTEAAAVFGCSPATFSVRLHRARSRLGKEFRKLESDEATSGSGAVPDVPPRGARLRWSAAADTPLLPPPPEDLR